MSAEAQATEPDVMTFPVVDQVTREIREPLTHDDYQSKSHELGALVRRINSEEIGLKAYSKVKRGEIETLEEERDDLIRELDRGIGRDVECDVRLDEARKLRLIVRRDTGETIAEEPFRASDYPPPLFAGVDDGTPAVPFSRKVREAFLGTLGDKPGGAAVLKLHSVALLDPTDFEVEGQRKQLDDDEPEAAILRDWIADAESDLDEMEATLAQMIADDGCSEADLIAIAINSRTSPTSTDAETGAIWDKLLEVRDARAAIDFCHGELMRATAETVEHDDRSGQIAATADPEPVAGDVELEMEDAVPHSRTLRTLTLGERVGRLGVPEYWSAHDLGILDPTEDDLRHARAKSGFERLSTNEEASLLVELAAVEQDLAADIKSSAKARMAITRGTWPTKVAKVDDGIAAVRELRARLDVDLEAEAATP